MITHRRQRMLIVLALVPLIGCVLISGGMLLGVRMGIVSIPRMAIALGPVVLASDEAGVRQLDTRPPRVRLGQSPDYVAATLAIPIIEDRSYWIAVLALRRRAHP